MDLAPNCVSNLVTNFFSAVTFGISLIGPEVRVGNPTKLLTNERHADGVFCKEVRLMEIQGLYIEAIDLAIVSLTCERKEKKDFILPSFFRMKMPKTNNRKYV